MELVTDTLTGMTFVPITGTVTRGTDDHAIGTNTGREIPDIW